jgi:hypothetical protein
MPAVSGLRFTAAAAGLSFAAATYCLIHGFVIDVEMNLPRTLVWAVVSTLPWLCAWEALRWLDKRTPQSLQYLLSAGVLIAALAVCVALEYALGARALAEIVYQLLPIPFGIAVVRWLMRPSQPAPVSAADPVFTVPTRQGTIAVRACDIEYIKAAGNYVELVTGERTLLMRATLQDLCDQLTAVGFVRVHRSLLVNPLHVVATRRAPRGRRIVELRSGAELPIGRQFGASAAAFVTIEPRSSQRD